MLTDWNMVAALGQVASAVIAAAGLGFIGWQIYEGRKTSDLQSLQMFLQSASDHEAKLLHAETEETKDQAFFEYLNFLEIYASAVNGSLFPKVSNGMVTEKIRDSIALIDAFPEWHGKFHQAVITPSTFDHLKAFMCHERGEIKKLKTIRLRR